MARLRFALAASHAGHGLAGGRVTDIAQLTESVDTLKVSFEDHRYICSNQIATAVYLAFHLRKPVLIEGPPEKLVREEELRSIYSVDMQVLPHPSLPHRVAIVK